MQMLLSEVSITIWLNFRSFPNRFFHKASRRRLSPTVSILSHCTHHLPLYPSSPIAPLLFQQLVLEVSLRSQPTPTLGPILTLGRNNLRNAKSILPVSCSLLLVLLTRCPSYSKDPVSTVHLCSANPLDLILAIWVLILVFLPRIITPGIGTHLALVTCPKRMEFYYLSSRFPDVKPQSEATKSSCSAVKHTRDENSTLPLSSYVTLGVWINLYGPQRLQGYLSYPLNERIHSIT